MQANDLKQLLARRPFEPIRIHLSSGEHVDVRHPEMAIVAKSMFAVGMNESEGNGIADYVVHYSLIHIVKIEPLNGSSVKQS